MPEMQKEKDAECFRVQEHFRRGQNNPQVFLRKFLHTPSGKKKIPQETGKPFRGVCPEGIKKNHDRKGSVTRGIEI